MQLKDLPGLSELKQQLITSAQNNRNGHALLFHGVSSGLGLPLALAYAQYLSCTTPLKDDSCGHCKSCIQFQQLSFPDLHFSFPIANKEKSSKTLNCDNYMRDWYEFLNQNPFFGLNDWTDAAGFSGKSVFISVHEIRRLNEKLNYKSYAGGKKFIIIYLPEFLNISAANKFLKTLEEPSDDSQIFLISEKPELLLQTITSRCQKVFVPPLKDDELNSFLQAQGLEPEHARISTSLANGSILEALRISKNNHNFLEYAQLFKNWMRGCYSAKTKEIFTFVDEFAKLGKDRQQEAIQFFMQTIELSYKAETKGLQANHPLFDQIQFKLHGFASVLHFKNSKEAYEVLSDAASDLRRNGNVKLILSDVSFKFSNLLRMKAS